MNITTVAVDLAKDVFELALADSSHRIVERKRLKRAAFARAFDNRAPVRIVMEACGSAHYWARHFQRLGHSVRLLPAHAVRPYVRRNKTDRADAAGLLEADRCGELCTVPIKSPEQQGIQGLHRVREHLKATRTATINLIRGLLREFGIVIPTGASKLRPTVLAALEDGDNELPMALRHSLAEQLDQVVALETQMATIEKRLAEFARRDTRSLRFMKSPGIGLITATAVSASVGELDRFPSGRHFANWLGIPPREHSSGNSRRLGRMSKRGDTYLRLLLIHGARSALRAAKHQEKKGAPLDLLQTWALDVQQRHGHNKAAVALANKMARRLWATEHHRRDFDGNHASHRRAIGKSPVAANHAREPQQQQEQMRVNQG